MCTDPAHRQLVDPPQVLALPEAVASMAAASHRHGLQIALQLFWLLSFFPEPLSMTAQSLIARDTTDRQQVTKTAWLLIRLAGFLAVMLAGMVAVSFLFGAYLFSPEQDIVDGVHDLVLPVRLLRSRLFSPARGSSRRPRAR